MLTKLCNYPGLVHAKALAFLEQQNEEIPESKQMTINDFFPEDFDESFVRTELSGKLTVLKALLDNVKKNTDDKVVVVSNFTKTLDVIQSLCNEQKWKFFRLDGKTEQTKRQQYVDSFNSPFSDTFVFLLSSKAGGTGLNLIGANRLILVDSDWNPATDRQAMARVWRDGQNKRVFLYRLLMTGSIDEKIFQRQLSKEGLSASVLDSAFGKVQFSKTDLKDVFSLAVNTLCDTHDLICDCWRKGKDQGKSSVLSRKAAFDISRWNHLNDPKYLKDDVALREAGQAEPDAITAVFVLNTEGKKYAKEVEDGPKPMDVEDEEEDDKIEENVVDEEKDDSDIVEMEVFEEDDDEEVLELE